MNSDIETLRSIPSGKPVRIFLPIKDIAERVRAQCVFQETKPPAFSLVFKPGVLPAEEIDLGQPCLISIDVGGPTISIEAIIKNISNQQTLDLELQKSISHEQMRDFFRVDAVTQVISMSFGTELVASKDEPWSITGETVDISGSGILAIFDKKVPDDDQVQLEITVPLPEPEKIRVLAHPVRSQQLKDGRIEVAYHFDDISLEDRDKIIGCCLVIQRQMLRLKVQIKSD